MVHDTSRRAVLIGAAGIGLGAVGTAAADDEALAQYIVTGGNAAQLEREGFTVAHEILDANVYLVRGPADSDPSTANGVDAAFEDFSYSLDVQESPADAETDGATEDDQWDKHLMDAFEAHEYATGAGTRIGILDTGVDHEHPDLGNVDAETSRSFLGWEESEHIGDAQTHGTHVAGITGATGAEGVTGVAPATELVSLRVFAEEGGANVGDSFLALEYAAELGLDAVNMSIGSAPQPPEDNQEGFRIARQRVVRSVTQRGTAVITSAGNDSQNLQQGGWISLWGSLPNATSVSATTIDDELADFSNYGANEIAVGAPGAEVLSTLPDSSYGLASGTSMSAPQVAGLVGLVRELEPDANANQVENVIERGAEGGGRGDPETGAGRINALETVRTI
ncbi:S8 family peptidase [Natronococcus roseus]|uniref:S8 family peptidase n=1 Tax=Natronococcus roseus TaxID=1052014 RepID=UPI00374DE71B